MVKFLRFEFSDGMERLAIPDEITERLERFHWIVAQTHHQTLAVAQLECSVGRASELLNGEPIPENRTVVDLSRSEKSLELPVISSVEEPAVSLVCESSTVPQERLYIKVARCGTVLGRSWAETVLENRVTAHIGRSVGFASGPTAVLDDGQQLMFATFSDGKPPGDFDFQAQAERNDVHSNRASEFLQGGINQ